MLKNVDSYKEILKKILNREFLLSFDKCKTTEPEKPKYTTISKFHVELFKGNVV